MGQLGRMLLASLRDLTPVVLVIIFFQVAVLGQPVSALSVLLEGALLVVVGLTLFVYGLQLALFPIGESVAHALARKGSFVWLVVFAFVLGFGSAVAEPALNAVATEAAGAAASAGIIGSTDPDKARYALGLRLTVAFAVGVALVVGVTRIVLGWPLSLIVMVCYALIALLSFLAPQETIGIAFDSGGVTTSVITVPLVTALGIGLASSLEGRNPLTDGFGMVVIVILLPMIFVMAFGLVLSWL
jgi:hypothetical protein